MEGQTLLIHLVELYINAVIYHRHIYPDPCFQRRRAFSAFGYVSVFPPLHVYIRRILERAVQLIKDKTLYVVEVVFEANNEEVESHELKIKQLNLSEIDGEIEERMKEFLLQLDTKFRALKALPKNPTFKINLITTNGSLQKINEDLEFQEFLWVRNADPAEFNKDLLYRPLCSDDHLGIDVAVSQRINMIL